MSEQKPLDATFFAFKKRERSFVLTSASVAYYLVLIALSVAFFSLTWGAWGGLIAWYFTVLGDIQSGAEPTPPDPQTIMAVAPYYLGIIPISLLLYAAFEAACLRWLVRGEAGGGLFGLKLDADTWRVFAVYGFWLLYLIAAVALVAACYALVIALGGLGGALQLVAMLLGALLPIGFLVLLVWGAVLFAPAAATSIGRKKLTFISARKVSAPRYWPLLTSYLLVIVGYFVVATIVSSIFQIPINSAMRPVVAAMLNGGDGAQMMSALREALVTPVMIAVITANILASLVLATIYYVAMFGVNARAFEAAVEAGDVARG